MPEQAQCQATFEFGKKADLKNMIIKESPLNYGIDRNIWTAKILIEVIYKK